MKKIERPETTTVKDKDTVIAALETLKKNQGWKILCEVLEVNIKKIESSILEADDDWSPAKLTKFRDMRFFEKQLLELPDKIIASYKVEGAPKETIELDPYKELDNE